ncbi:hypothetical protein BVX98_01700, partial [bacterium F11]
MKITKFAFLIFSFSLFLLYPFGVWSGTVSRIDTYGGAGNGVDGPHMAAHRNHFSIAYKGSDGNLKYWIDDGFLFISAGADNGVPNGNE